VACRSFSHSPEKWIDHPPACHDHHVTRPGLAKARGLPLVCSRHALLVRAPEPRLRDLFDGADVLSEGCVRDEQSGRVWYGSTSLILAAAPDEWDLRWLAALVERDVHVRLRAVRIAHREASLRAPTRLGRLACEMRVVPHGQGVRIDVDVQAPLIERSAGMGAAR
jgi:hypothetical protein